MSELLGAILFFGISGLSLRLRKERPLFTQKGWNLVIVGLFTIGVHALLDGIDTIVYHMGEHMRTAYKVLDVTEELVSSLGWVLFAIGLIMFARYLLELWHNPELEEEMGR